MFWISFFMQFQYRRSFATLFLATIFYFLTNFVAVPYLFEKNQTQLKHVRFSGFTVFLDSFSPVVFLFLGPCTLNIMDLATYYSRGLSIEESVKLSLPLLGQSRWIVFRNLVVAPIAEELVFRGCVCKLLYCCGSSSWAVLLSSTFFAASHFHHFIYRSFVYGSLRTAILVTILQISYTFLFGIYSAWVFVRFERIIPSICLHSFCNFFGTPDLSKVWCHRYRWPLFFIYLMGISLFLYSVLHISS